MEKNPDQRIMRLARSCAGLGSAARREFLDRECEGDEELRQTVEAVIREDEFEATQVLTNDYENTLPDYYRLIALLGRGGMAEVFLAEDKRLGRSVAIKFLNSEFRKDLDRMRRFDQEARAASALNHPNILTIHDIGEKDGVQFIVSEYVDGETLSSRVSRGRIPLTEAVEIAIQIASALAASHKAGIVHRDIKPDNVMVRRDGSVKVLDFGLAKETGNDYSNLPDFDARTLDRISTAPGMILGTPQYMSPEQARGGHLDARTDIFSFGIILFEMVTGRSPFKGNSMADTIAAIVSKEPRRLEKYLQDPPLTLVRVVDKALRKEKEERYLTMDQLLADLKELRRELAERPNDAGPHTAATEARTTFLHHTLHGVLASRFVHSKWALVVPTVVIAAAAIWWYAGRWPQAAPVPPGSFRSDVITSWSSGAREPVTAAAFSPDAKWIAFAATKTGATEIWAKPVIGGDPVQVTKNGFYNQYPVWSPSGQEIAYFSSRGENYGIWRTSMTGGDQTQILGNAGRFARPTRWSKDGKIYFQDGPDLFSVDLSTGERLQVTQFASSDQRPRAIEISPDASKVAYSIKDGRHWKVRVVRLNSGESKEIASSEAQVVDLEWRPDGNSVLFSGSTGATYQIFEAGLTGGDPVQLSNANSDVYLQDVSADGSRILYSSVNEASDLWRVDTQNLTESIVANEVSSEYWADIAPDGSIAYQSVPYVDSPFGGAIRVVPTAGKPVTVSPSGFSPVWSNDGQWIAYFRSGPNGVGIWRVRPSAIDGSALVDSGASPPEYTQTPYLKIGANHLNWSPDDRHLAYSARVGDLSNIWLSASDLSGSRRLTQNTDRKEIYCCPAWTPDAKGIVFASQVRPHTETGLPFYRLWSWHSDNNEAAILFESRQPFLLLGVADGGKEAVIVQNADAADLTANPKTTYVYLLPLKAGSPSKVNSLDYAYFHNIHLSRDGRSIAFVSRRENETALWSVPVRGGTPRRLVVDNDPKIMISSLKWSPDGETIVFGRQTRTNLLSMLSK